MEMEQIFGDPKDCDILILKNELEEMTHKVGNAERVVDLLQKATELQGKVIEHLSTVNSRLEETLENFTRPGHN